MKKISLVLLAGLASVPLVWMTAGGRPTAQEAVQPDRAATEEIVRTYLLENPEVVVEALERWRDLQDLAAATQAEDAALAALPMLLSGETGVAMGAAADDADVLVAEFFDYHCGYCRRATDFVMGLAEEDGIRVVFQDLPILREESRAAALAGLAAAEDDAYAAMHRQLMRTSGVLNEAAVTKAARRAGASKALSVLDTEDGSARLTEKLEASVNIAREMGLSGTPTFVVADPRGRLLRVVPAYDPEAVEAAIAEVRAL